MKKGIQKDSIISMGGVSLCLVALIIVFSQFKPETNVFHFLSDGITSLVGPIGLFVFSLFIFTVGMYMLMLKKLAKFKLGANLWGILVLVIAFLMIFTFYGSKTDTPINVQGIGECYIQPYARESTEEEKYIFIELGNFGNVFTALKENNSGGFSIQLGGGLLGFFLVALFNSLITPIGTTIIIWLLIVLGLCLVLNQQIKKLFKHIKKGKKHQEDSYDYEDFRSPEPVSPSRVEPSLVRDDFRQESTPTPVSASSDPKVLQDLSIHTYNNTHNLKKAHFVFDDEIDESENLDQASFAGVNKSLNSFPGYEEPFGSQIEMPKQSVPEPSFNNITTSNSSLEEQPIMDESPIMEEPAPAPVMPEPEPEPAAPVDPRYRPQPKAVVKPPFELPPMSLLDYHEEGNDADANKQSNDDRVNLINTIFNNLRVGAQAVSYVVGPSVTRFDIQMNPDVSVSTMQRYVNDISIRLGGVPTRFEPIVFGKATSGLEIPNEIRTNVGLRESIEALQPGEKFLRYIPFGKNISGDLVSANLSDFPHMLVSGTTGSGKSIFVHSVIMTLLMRNNPDQLRLILIDPKKVEMTYYNDIPHLLCPVITEPKKAFVAFQKLVDEMERRYNLFQTNRVRDIGQFNKFAKEQCIEPLPYIVVFVDEYADLNDECKEIRGPVVRIAQKARSAGIHIVIATQRPSVNVLDGVIKANIPTHVALMVSNYTDSVSIIGEGGAEALLGNGDMLVECPLISRTGKPRVQGCFVDTSEINRVCDYLRNHYGPQYDPTFLDLEDHSQDVPEPSDAGQVTVVDKEASEEQLYEIIKSDIVTKQFCSISYIQRTYGVGFPKAGRLFNKLLKDGYVSSDHDARGSRVLIHENVNEQQIGSIEQSTFIPSSEPEEVPPMVESPIEESPVAPMEEIKPNEEL